MLCDSCQRARCRRASHDDREQRRAPAASLCSSAPPSVASRRPSRRRSIRSASFCTPSINRSRRRRPTGCAARFCNTTMADFRATGRWGVRGATRISRRASASLLRRVHGNHRHVGRDVSPADVGDARARQPVLGELKDRLRARDRQRTIRARGGPARSHSGDGMTVDLSLLPDGGVGWLDASGRHSDIVLSTRIRSGPKRRGLCVYGPGARTASGCACCRRCARRWRRFRRSAKR